MARRAPSSLVRPPQLRRPALASISPMPRRMSVLLPEPFGPTSRVGAPGEIVSEIRSRIVTPPARTLAPSNEIGRSLMLECIRLSRTEFAVAPDAPGNTVHTDHER